MAARSGWGCEMPGPLGYLAVPGLTRGFSADGWAFELRPVGKDGLGGRECPVLADLVREAQPDT